ncbi:unnamed protein product [Bursaphelenchus xylophilus]|uniref:(pine wood nematode) hypothetical protein n=1 Tax=Bursaphelenchus xylophilus TaxID=6326 RepID=A0A1I7RXI9_BURXY|nr:unnamed protein product [Bursaphelenchus xylophilus]CAG9126468.1 unnamed protein product [Bursaphelenchus xylophilus]
MSESWSESTSSRSSELSSGSQLLSSSCRSQSRIRSRVKRASASRSKSRSQDNVCSSMPSRSCTVSSSSSQDRAESRRGRREEKRGRKVSKASKSSSKSSHTQSIKSSRSQETSRTSKSSKGSKTSKSSKIRMVKRVRHPEHASRLISELNEDWQNANLDAYTVAMYRRMFAGARTPREMEKLLRPTQFMVYYKRGERPFDQPLELPLFLGYKDSHDMTHHFPVINFKDTFGKRQWTIGASFDMPGAACCSLARLLEHHEIYSFVDDSTGDIDVFPVWQLRNSSNSKE